VQRTLSLVGEWAQYLRPPYQFQRIISPFLIPLGHEEFGFCLRVVSQEIALLVLPQKSQRMRWLFKPAS
jgi:hypothetical protein